MSGFAAGAGALKALEPLLAQASRLRLGLLEGKSVLARDWFRAVMPAGLGVGAGFLASAARAALPSISPSGASERCNPLALTWELAAAVRTANWRKEGSARRRTVCGTPVFMQAWCGGKMASRWALGGELFWSRRLSTADGMTGPFGRICQEVATLKNRVVANRVLRSRENVHCGKVACGGCGRGLGGLAFVGLFGVCPIRLLSHPLC